MKRPKSAKPGHRMLRQPSAIDSKEEDQYSRNMSKKKLKIMKPQLTTNDFGRIMPKKIFQDKEQLYSDTLQLKQTLNEISQENIKLKTRISILEREKDKMSKYFESVAENANKTHSRLKLYSGQNASCEKQNMMINNLKKMIRTTKDQNQYLKQENAKIKKAIKYTRINEIEIQKKMIQKENVKLNQLLNELNEQISDQEQYQREITQLRNCLEEEIQANKQFSDSNEKYIEYIEELQTKIQKQTEKWKQKQKRLQRQIALQKRKLSETIKGSDELRKQIKTLKDDKNQFKKKKETQPKSDEKQISQMKLQCSQLQQQLEQTKLKLQKSQARLEQKKQLSNETIPQRNSQQKKQQIKSQQHYSDEFQEEQPQKIKDDIQEYKKDFQQEEEEAQPLYQKKKKSKKYKPSKQILKQIKQLLTYRMKAQRYPFNELKKDIDASNQQKFTYNDLEEMMKIQPFYLSQKYTQIFLQYAFQKQNIKNKQTFISMDAFLQKVRKLVDNFELPSQQLEQEMLLRIAQMTTTYPSQLQASFLKIKNGPDTVSKEKLVQMFKKLQLDQEYINMIISQLSLCSDDLEHLNFHGFFERFLIESNQNQQQIDQQPQSSSKSEIRNSQKLSVEQNKFQLKEEQPIIRVKYMDQDDDEVVLDDGHI